MITLKSIAAELNLSKKTVENALTKARKIHGQLGRIEEIESVPTRVFNEDEKNTLMQYLPKVQQELKGSELTLVDVADSYQGLANITPTGRVSNVQGLNVDLDELKTMVFSLVQQGKTVIQETREQNKDLINSTLKTEKEIADQLETLKQLQTTAKMEEYVTSVVVKQSQENIKATLGKLQNLL